MPTPHDDLIASAVFEQILQSARELNLVEMVQLKAAYTGQTTYAHLSDGLRRKLRDVGMAAITAHSKRR